jgi:glycosyltransferase involved in cell wall biosynthesis
LLGRHGVPSSRISVLENFIADPGWAAFSRADAGEYALFVGRLVPEKGADVAIAAARAAGVALVIAGTGPDEARLRRLAGDADVRFAGWLGADQLAEVRGRAALLLAPSRWDEVSPFAVLEALAAGLPVLASDRGSFPDIIQRDWGRVLPAGDIDAWTTALRQLWGDPEGRRRRGNLALQQGRVRFGEERAYADLMQIYEGGA